MNKAAILDWAAALESGSYPEVQFGPMRSSAGFNKAGVLVDCWLKANPGPTWSPDGDVMGHAWLPPQEALRWLRLGCHPFECPRHGRSQWEIENDPVIEHCAACEANNFFLDVIAPNDSFGETAAKLRKWSDRI